jgi:hypothetical protein
MAMDTEVGLGLLVACGVADCRILLISFLELEKRASVCGYCLLCGGGMVVPYVVSWHIGQLLRSPIAVTLVCPVLYREAMEVWSVYSRLRG